MCTAKLPPPPYACSMRRDSPFFRTIYSNSVCFVLRGIIDCVNHIYFRLSLSVCLSLSSCRVSLGNNENFKNETSNETALINLYLNKNPLEMALQQRIELL